MLTVDTIISFLDESIAQATLQGGAAELRQIVLVTQFLSRTAAEQGDTATAEHMDRLAQIAGNALNRNA